VHGPAHIGRAVSCTNVAFHCFGARPDQQMAIRIYIVEDHRAMREMLADFLGRLPDLELCGMAGSGEEALLALPAAKPSVVLVDLSLPGLSGLDLIEEIRARSDCAAIVLSGHRDRSWVGQALAAGARGYVLKGNPREIPDAIRKVLDGRIYLSDSLDGVDDLVRAEGLPPR
jgi:DNA-binding NarL/FixJ family response regulator